MWKTNDEKLQRNISNVAYVKIRKFWTLAKRKIIITQNATRFGCKVTGNIHLKNF